MIWYRLEYGRCAPPPRPFPFPQKFQGEPMTDREISGDDYSGWHYSRPTQEELEDEGRWDCEGDGNEWAWTFHSASGCAYIWYTPRCEGEDEKPALEDVMPYVLSTPPF